MSARQFAVVAVGVAFVALVCPVASHAQLLRDVSGQVDVAAAQSSVTDGDQRSLRGLYRVSWARSIVPYVQVKAALLYSRFDVDIAQGASAWREDLRPSGDVTWRHPGFTLGASLSRRESTARVSATNVTRDDLGIHFRTRSTDWPILSIRFDDSRTFDDVVPVRDTRDRRLVSELTHTVGNQTGTYRYQHRWLQNVITGVDSDEDIHQAYWSGQLLALREDRFQLAGGYRFEHRERTDEVIGTGSILSPVRITAGLYAIDSSPELDALESLPGLIDGDLTTSTDPPVDIGGALSDRNVGADLRVPTEVSAIYVHVDGPSGTGVFWDAFVSDDNLVWDAVSPRARSSFNLANNRYEISFDVVRARYVKVVNVGTNDFLDVRVTEIEVFEAVPRTERSRTTSNSHLADARATYAIRSDLSASADFTYQHLPVGGFRTNRDDYTYSVTTRYEQTEAVSHTGRWAQEFQAATDRENARSANAISYTLDLEPMPSIRGVASVRSRRTYVAGSAEEKGVTALVRLRADPLQRLSVTMEVTRSRTERLDRGDRFDTWTGSSSVLAAVTRWLNVDIGTRIQNTRTRPGSNELARRGYHATAEVRPSPTMLLRGALNTSDDRGRTTTQDYLLSWRVTRFMTWSGQMQLNRSRSGGVSNRYSANVTHAIGRRGSVYLAYTRLFQRGESDQITNTFLQGVRYAF